MDKGCWRRACQQHLIQVLVVKPPCCQEPGSIFFSRKPLEKKISTLKNREKTTPDFFSWQHYLNGSRFFNILFHLPDFLPLSSSQLKYLASTFGVVGKCKNDVDTLPGQRQRNMRVSKKDFIMLLIHPLRIKFCCKLFYFMVKCIYCLLILGR